MTPMISFASVLLSCFLTVALTPSAFCHNANFKVVGFFKGKLEDVNRYEFEKLTHIVFCFTQLQGNLIAFEEQGDENILRALVAKKKQHPALKVLVSLGGWSGCATCSDVFQHDSNRVAFARSVEQFIASYDVDGFDVDWESPVIGGKKGHSFSPHDKSNFTLLMKSLRTAFGNKYELCFDANSFYSYVTESIDWKSVMPYVDFVNLMTYGLPSDTSRHTGHHTALYSSTYQRESVASCLALLDSIGVPHNKIVIGCAFYGFAYKGVDSVNNGLRQLAKASSSIDYHRIHDSCNAESGFVRYYDSVAHAPFLYSASKTIFVTFDDKQSCIEKVQYAFNKGLAGVMFWRLNGDKPRDGLLDAIYNAVHRH